MAFMDQTLDMQVAALIFLAGTRCLVNSDHTGGVETTMDDEEDSDEPAPNYPLRNRALPLHPSQSFGLRGSNLSNTMRQFVQSSYQLLDMGGDLPQFHEQPSD
tara:strand:- start:141 stop:449 length:309 start_codon:yes stop_codon:yes gene_type:complete